MGPELPEIMYNKLIVAGTVASPVAEPRIAGVPEPGRAADNVVTQLRVRVNGRGSREKPVSIAFDVWGRLARDCHRLLAQGSRVLVDARLKQHEWKDGTGMHARIVFVANSVQFFGLPGCPANSLSAPEPKTVKEPPAERKPWHAKSGTPFKREIRKTGIKPVPLRPVGASPRRAWNGGEH